jgi:hypothetical protein
MRRLDGDKLFVDMEARCENLLQLVHRDFGGDTSKLYDQYWELKFWLESLRDRGDYDLKED